MKKSIFFVLSVFVFLGLTSCNQNGASAPISTLPAFVERMVGMSMSQSVAFLEENGYVIVDGSVEKGWVTTCLADKSKYYKRNNNDADSMLALGHCIHVESGVWDVEAYVAPSEASKVEKEWRKWAESKLTSDQYAFETEAEDDWTLVAYERYND